MVRPEVVDDLVAHLTVTRGHAVLEGALGSGLRSALHLCRDELRARGVSVDEAALEGLRGAGASGPSASADEDSTAPGEPGVLLVDLQDLPVLRAVGAGPLDPVDLRGLADLLAAHQAGGAPVLVVCRSHPATAAVVEVAQEAGARHFVLRPWGEPQVRALLTARRLDPSAAGEVAVRTGGLPWLVSLCCSPPTPGASVEEGLEARTRAAVDRLLDDCTEQLADVVLALAVGYPVSGGPLLPMADDDPVLQEDLLSKVDNAGLLGADGTLPPLVRESLLAHASPHRLDRWRRQLVDDVVASGRDLAQWAEDLAAQCYDDSRVHAALVRRAGELQASDPLAAADVLRTAVTLGPADPSSRVELSRLLLLAGDVTGAAQEFEPVLTATADDVPPGLVDVGLSLAWAQDQPQRAVDLVRWAAERDLASAAGPGAAITRYGVGDRAGGDAALDAVVRTPEVAASAFVQTAEGVQASLGLDPLSCLPPLVQAAEAMRTATGFAFPADAPAAYAALVGLHIGDPALVRSMVDSALQTSSLGAIGRQRLTLLRLWADLDVVPAAVTDAVLDGLGVLAPREGLWSLALRARLARRADDPVRLRHEWAAAREAVLRHPVSLWQLPPLTELGLVAARMHEFERVRPLWRQAEDLLERLGQPPLWATPFHWTGVLVALQLDRPQAAAPHAAALVHAAEHWPLAGVLAGAGRAWVRVRAHEVDVVEVEKAAGELARVGYAWEASRLAAHGAAATDDRRVSARLLECARAHRPRPAKDAAAAAPTSPAAATAGARPPVPTPARPAPSPVRPAAQRLRLTDRERQVAELVLEGRTYRQVGEALFLSAKTVEHHMARLRRRSGATTRAELLELLLAELSAHGDEAR